MGGPLGRFIAWVNRHPGRAKFAGAVGAAVLAAVVEAAVSGAQSYVLAGVRWLLRCWHPFPAWGWLVLGPLAGLGLLWVWESFLRRPDLPDEALGFRWRCVWSGRRIVKMDPVCPNPNCGADLNVTTPRVGIDPISLFQCPSDSCGFWKRFDANPGAVLATATQYLESQAAGRPTEPPDPPRARNRVG